MISERLAARAALALILAAALAWRLHNIAFGLPSMYDPDEPIFMITALKLLAEGTLNPGWFGHPGSTTIYLVALIDAAIAAVGLVTGRYADLGDFARAAYADPGLLFIPARVSMALIGVACVWLTYLLGRRIGGPAAGLIGAAMLAVNGLHIAWSQVIRTDIHASLFMLASMLFAIRALSDQSLRDYLIAGAFAGFATVTKWPAAMVFAGLAGASLQGWWSGRGTGPMLRNLGAGAAGALVAMVVASPFLILDWHTVLANVSGEVKTSHLGHSSDGVIANVLFYCRELAGSMGAAGALLAVIGAGVATARSRAARWVVLPVSLAFFGLICSQGLVWSRWILPLLPMACLFVGVAIVASANLAAEVTGRKLAAPLTALLTLVVAVPSVAVAVNQTSERANDTRALAARWAREHIPAGSRVVFEHLEISLRDEPWTFLFPIGDAGCINGLRALRTGVDFEEVQRLRRGSPIIDVGNVNSEKLGSCRADFAILSYYDLYTRHAAAFPREMANYRRLLVGGRTVALFAPKPGRAGGPVVRIVALPEK